jgi:hypothetical protein
MHFLRRIGLAVAFALAISGSAFAKGPQPLSAKAIDHQAHVEASRAVRAMVVRGGVKGSKSGNDYVTYYREGWNRANFVRPSQPAAAAEGADHRPQAQAPEFVPKVDAHLEANVREMLSTRCGPEGRLVLQRLDKLGVKLLFRQKGGTTNDAEQKAIYIESHKSSGEPKPTSWMVASLVHEVSHAIDDAEDRTPPTKSPRFAEYRGARVKTAVTHELREAMVKERRTYVNGQVNGEARAMSREARILRTLEEQGEDLGDLNRTVLDTYKQAYEQAVQRLAGQRPH